MIFRVALWGCFMLIIGAVQGRDLVLSLDQILHRIWENNTWLKSLNLEAQRLHYESLTLNNNTLPSLGIGTVASPLITPPKSSKIYPYIQLHFQYKILFNSKLKEQQAYLRALGSANDNNKEIYFNQLRVEVKKICFDWIMALRQVDTLYHYLSYLQLMKKTEEQNLNHGNIGRHYGEIHDENAHINEEQATENSTNAIMLAEVKATELQSLITSLLAYTDNYRYTLNSLMEREPDFMFIIDTAMVRPALISAENFDSSNLIYYRKDLQKTDKMLNALQLKMQIISPNKQPPEIKFTFQPLFSTHNGSAHLFNFLAQANIPIFGKNSLSQKAEKQSLRLQMRALDLAKRQEYKKIQSRLYVMETQIDLSKHKIQTWEQKIFPKLRQIFHSHMSMYELNQVNLTTLLEDWEKLKNVSLQILAERLNIWKLSAEYDGELYR